MKPLHLNRPYLLVVVGLPGSGKTFFAEKFSDMFGAPLIDYAYYRQLINDTKLCNIVINDMIAKLLTTKHTIIIEGPGYKKQGRAELKEVADKNGYELLFVWVQTDPNVAEKRSKKGPRKLSGQDFENEAKRFQLLEKGEPYIVISGKHTYQTQIRSVLSKMASRKPATLAKSPDEKKSRESLTHERI